MNSTEQLGNSSRYANIKSTCPEVLVIGNFWVRHLKNYYDPRQASVDFIFGQNWDLNIIINRLPEVMRPSHSYMYVFGLLTEEFEEVEFGPIYKLMQPRQSFSFVDTLKKLEELVKVARSFNPEITIYIDVPPIVSLSCYNKRVLKSASSNIKQLYGTDRQYSVKALFDETLKRYNDLSHLKEQHSQLGLKFLSVADMKTFARDNEKAISTGGLYKPNFLSDGVNPTSLCAKNIMHWFLIFIRREEHRKYGKPEIDPSLKKKKKRKKGRGDKKKNNFASSFNYLSNHR